MAGAVVFVSDEVCHVQYNAASPAGRSGGAQDLVLVSIIERFATSHRWIDLGISTEQDGRVLNAGLADYKEGFGASAVNYDFYQLAVR